MLEPPGQFAEHVVPGVMSKLIVDLLEMVDVGLPRASLYPTRTTAVVGAVLLRSEGLSPNGTGPLSRFTFGHMALGPRKAIPEGTMGRFTLPLRWRHWRRG